MKYFRLLFFGTLFFCHTAFSEGLYDGIWNIDELGYASIHQNGEKLIVIILDSEADPDDGDYVWEAYLGGLKDNKSTQTTLISGVLAEIEIVFDTETKLSAKLKSCRPQTGDCGEAFPVGAIFNGNKIW